MEFSFYPLSCIGIIYSLASAHSRLISGIHSRVGMLGADQKFWPPCSEPLATGLGLLSSPPWCTRSPQNFSSVFLPSLSKSIAARILEPVVGAASQVT